MMCIEPTTIPYRAHAIQRTFEHPSISKTPTNAPLTELVKSKKFSQPWNSNKYIRMAMVALTTPIRRIVSQIDRNWMPCECVRWAERVRCSVFGVCAAMCCVLYATKQIVGVNSSSMQRPRCSVSCVLALVTASKWWGHTSIEDKFKRTRKYNRLRKRYVWTLVGGFALIGLVAGWA